MPCAAAPAQQQPVTTGGGAPMKGVEGGGQAPAPAAGTEVAPDPVTAGQPAPGAQPAAPADVSGGGATTYEAAPDPVQCGQWVPAPVVVGGTEAPSGTPSTSDSPPEPVAGPQGTGSSGDADAVATGPASQLSTWPEWQQHFQALGLRPEELARIGSAPLTDGQLAAVYEDIHTGIVERGGIPGQASPTQTTWSPAWEQRFLALGLPGEFVNELRAEAQRTGAGDAQLEAIYGALAQQVAPGKPGQQVPGTQPAPGQQGPAQQEGPGWNPQVEQAFRDLGMPDEVIQLYAQSGAPLSGLEAAHRHASARLADFKERGWHDRFVEAKVPAVEMWGLILGDQPAKDEDLQKALDAHRKGQMSIWQKGGQLASSLFPGGRLAQYVVGKEFVSGEKIDRTSPMEIGMAALSGLAVFAAFRGVKNISAGWAARSGNYTALNNVNDTLLKMGLPATGTASMTDAALGATQTWGTKQKLISLIPGTQLHKQVVGLGHAEAAARAFNGGGAVKLMSDPDGALQVATLAQVFDDIKSGAVRINGGALAYLGPFRKAAPMVLDVKKGQEVITVAKNLKIGNGNSQLVSLMEVGGTKLGRTPEWLRNAANLGKEVGELAQVERDTLGRIMAGNAARNLGDFTKDGFRPMRYIMGLRSDRQPEWYARLAAETAKQFTPGVPGMSDELLDVLTGHHVFGRIFDEGTTAIRAIDRSTLPEGMGALLDDASKSMDEARAALDAAKAAGKGDAAAMEALDRFHQAVRRIHGEDAELAARLFPTYVDESLFVRAQADALQAVRAGHAGAGAAAGAADEVVEAAAANADEVADVAAANADEVADAVDDVAARTAAPAAPAPAGPAAPATDAAEGAVMATPPVAPARAAEPVSLTVNARGEAVTPSGLVVPSYASPVSGLAPADATNGASIARLQAMFDQVRNGAPR